MSIAAVAFSLLAACEDDNETKRPAAPEVNYIYVTGSTSTTIDAFIQDRATGTLTEVPSSPFVGISSNREMIAHPSATTLFIDQSGGGKVLIKSIDPADGHLSNISEGTIAVAGAATSYVALTPDGTRFYGTDDSALALRGFAFDQSTRDLSALSWSPFSTGLAPNVAAMDATGSYFYIASSPNFFYSYALDPDTGAPSATVGSPLSSSFTSVFRLVADPLGEYMFAYSGSTNELISLQIQPTGTLAVAQTVTVGTFVNAVSVSPDGNYVFAAAGSSGLFVYQFNRADGSFTAVPGSPYHAEFMPQYAAATPDGKYVYVAEQTASALAGFEIQSDGSLVKLDEPDGELMSTPEFVLIVEPPAAE